MENKSEGTPLDWDHQKSNLFTDKVLLKFCDYAEEKKFGLLEFMLLLIICVFPFPDVKTRYAKKIYRWFGRKGPKKAAHKLKPFMDLLGEIDLDPEELKRTPNDREYVEGLGGVYYKFLDYAVEKGWGRDHYRYLIISLHRSDHPETWSSRPELIGDELGWPKGKEIPIFDDITKFLSIVSFKTSMEKMN